MANQTNSSNGNGGGMRSMNPSRLPHETAVVVSAVIRAIWLVTVLTWPILKWVLVSDCVIQLIKMIYHWGTPGHHAGLIFLLHFFFMTAVTYFVSAFKPKGL